MKYKISKLTLIKWYRINYKRLCTEVNKLNKQIEKLEKICEFERGEEKEAIEYIKAFQKDLYGASEKNLMAIYIDRVWNYIDKLQKENEELKEKIREFEIGRLGE